MAGLAELLLPGRGWRVGGGGGGFSALAGATFSGLAGVAFSGFAGGATCGLAGGFGAVGAEAAGAGGAAAGTAARGGGRLPGWPRLVCAQAEGASRRSSAGSAARRGFVTPTACQLDAIRVKL